MVLTPPRIHKERILAVLASTPSGSLPRAEVLKRLSTDYGSRWSAEDQEPVATRPFERKWQNRASFVRADLVRQQLLTDTADGNWTLTQAGREEAIRIASGVRNFLDREHQRREEMWQELLAEGGRENIPPSRLRELGFYGGASEIFVNQEKTKTDFAPTGIAVSFLHTGTSYEDELTSTGVVYHYPRTNRLGHEESEIEASRAAYRTGLPVFLIGPGATSTTRTLYRGYVEDFDDSLEVLLITFTEDSLPSPPPGADAELPFSLTDEELEDTYSKRRNRPNQARFAFNVFQRYGTACAACGLDVAGLVQAAHLRAKKERGSDDARNGLPLCANHHIALDKGFWGIEPASTQFRASVRCSNLGLLRIVHPDLSHLKKLPHADALDDAWQTWQKDEVRRSHN